MDIPTKLSSTQYEKLSAVELKQTYSTAFEKMEMANVFNPPVTANEVHNADGAYQLAADTRSDLAVLIKLL